MFPNHAVLIGDNNTGKTTILEALDLALGPDRLNRTHPIDEHDFFQGKYVAAASDNADETASERNGDQQPAEVEHSKVPRIEIEVVITDLTEEQKARFGDYTEFWNKQSNTFYDEPNPAGVDAADITEALRITFHGWYVPQKTIFRAGPILPAAFLRGRRPVYFPDLTNKFAVFCTCGRGAPARAR